MPQMHAVTYNLKLVTISYLYISACFSYSYMVSVIYVLNMAGYSAVVSLCPIKLECMGSNKMYVMVGQ